MKQRTVVIGLGNTLMGDDGVAGRVLELLAVDPEIAQRVDFYWAGTDLLNAADELAGREWVILVDAVDGSAAGEDVLVVEDVLQSECRQQIHSISAPQSLMLLRAVLPRLGATRFKWVLAPVGSVRLEGGLSEAAREVASQAAERISGLIESLKSSYCGPSGIR